VPPNVLPSLAQRNKREPTFFCSQIFLNAIQNMAKENPFPFHHACPILSATVSAKEAPPEESTISKERSILFLNANAWQFLTPSHSRKARLPVV
jgi:hypothetical protein